MLMPYFIWRYVNKNINIAGCLCIIFVINIIYSLLTGNIINFVLNGIGMIIGIVLIFFIDGWLDGIEK
jgi:hypothetical protein